jgi:hypothetical protein
MAQYLKSLVTGVVLPYVPASLKCADIRLMDPAECAEYEASLNKPVAEAAPTPAVETLPDPEVLVVEPEIGEVLVEDLDPVAEVLGALETD